jgi:hypothetical protein
MADPFGSPTSRTALTARRGDSTSRALVLDSSGRPVTSGRADADVFTERTPGPGVPLVPALPRGELPREFVPTIGENLNYIPRTAFPELTPFQTLRNLADASDIVRLAIEDVIQQVVGLEWDVHPIDAEGGTSERKQRSKALAPNVIRVKEFLKRPDRDRSFKAWLTSLLEDCLVLDALCFYRELDLLGRPRALVQIDGASITPLVDPYGRLSEAPAAAYQQVAYGRVETEFHRPYLDREEWASAVREAGGDAGKYPTELVYTPRKPRVWSPYGQSPVERVIITVNLALRRQLHYLAYYTDGNIPEAFWKCPASWEPVHVEKMQDDFEKLLEGESGARRRLRFMPGGEGAGLENPRGADEWKKEFDEYLARVVCYAFNTSPLPLVQLMNRSTSEQADAGETHSGHHPLMEYVAHLITREIQEFLGEPELEFIWTEDKERDERLFVDKSMAFVGKGILTIDEVRDDMGLDATGIPRFIDSAAGPIFFDDLIGKPTALGELVPRGGANPLNVPLPPAAGGGSAIGGAPPHPPNGGGGAASEAARALAVPLPPAAAGKAMSEDLRRWRKVAMKAISGKSKRRACQFQSASIPTPLKAALEEWLDWSNVAEDVDWAFRSLVKARRPLVAARRRIRLERKLRIATKDHFKSVAPAVAQLLMLHYVGPPAIKAMSKVEGPPDDQIDAAMKWDAFFDAVRPTLAESFLEGETLAADASGAEIAFGLTDEQATAYAEARAAEMVGKRLLEDGSLVDNPNAKWSISQTERDRLKATIAKAFEEGWTEQQLQEEIESPAFWSWRSDTIARTEVALALNKGTVQTYRDANVATVTLVDGPGCLLDGHDDSVEGVDGDVVTVEEFDQYPLGHPNCRRDAIPNLPEPEP